MVAYSFQPEHESAGAARGGSRVRAKMKESTIRNIDVELDHARVMFPMPNPTFVALVEEVGELAQALLKCQLQRVETRHVYNEALQVVVMGIRIMEEGDAQFPAYDQQLALR